MSDMWEAPKKAERDKPKGGSGAAPQVQEQSPLAAQVQTQDSAAEKLLLRLIDCAERLVLAGVCSDAKTSAERFLVKLFEEATNPLQPVERGS